MPGVELFVNCIPPGLQLPIFCALKEADGGATTVTVTVIAPVQPMESLPVTV